MWAQWPTFVSIMGLRNKIFWGFGVIAFILLLSGLVSIFEVSRMRDSVSSVLNESVADINASRALLEVTDEQVYHVLSQIGIAQDSALVIENVFRDARFESFIYGNRQAFNTAREKAVSDTIMYAYAAYMQVLALAPYVWETGDYEARKLWYLEVLQPAYNKLRGYIQGLIELEQYYLEETAHNIQSGFYRGIMPCVIAIVVGILLVFLFYYFIGLYFIKPLLTINMGIREYLSFKKHYSVKLEGDDELAELNEGVSSLIEAHAVAVKQREA